jgi:hypothetical protein
MYWTGLDWTGLDCIVLDWTGLDWTGLDWTGLYLVCVYVYVYVCVCVCMCVSVCGFLPICFIGRSVGRIGWGGGNGNVRWDGIMLYIRAPMEGGVMSFGRGGTESDYLGRFIYV